MVGRFSWLMYLCHVSCMLFVVIVVGLGSFVRSWDASCVSVVARVDGAISSSGGVGVCPRCVVLRVPLLRLVLVFVFVPLLLFVFLIDWSNRTLPLPIEGLGVLGVSPHIVRVDIGLEVL